MWTCGQLIFLRLKTLNMHISVIPIAGFWIGLSKVQRPTKQIIGHIGDGGFCGTKDPTNSVKTLKEDRVLRIRLQSHQVHPTVLQSYDIYAV